MDTTDRLTVAAAAGDTDLLMDLLSTGIAVDAVDGRGRTALDRAVWAGATEAVRLLVAAGADVEQPIGEYREDTPLRFAAGRGDLPLAELLLEAGAEPDRRLHARQASALMVAASAGQGAVAEVLLARGADLELAAGGRGWTALEWAAHAGRLEAVCLLLARGAGRRAEALAEARQGQASALAALRAGEYPDEFSPERIAAYTEVIQALTSAEAAKRPNSGDPEQA
ncbi:ankyrin repeat domain-containing protein [Streptomyces sp. NBC_01341]|uniref:ankyrin repeat domain-containing protein n=1 Tax=Streptomyces sp. NBC_01341 TaxID=2903831 RepID=UPI002E1211AB|nr:ankyrin repeat domain-containing protein [Streptomyces sp. NBC_01341]